MDSVFTMLKEARKAKKLSLEDIADATYISVDFLKAIEEGKTNILPQAYVRAFIREYASVVGLNVDNVIHQLDAPAAPSAPQPSPSRRRSSAAPVQRPAPEEARPEREEPAPEETHPPEPVREEIRPEESAEEPAPPGFMSSEPTPSESAPSETVTSEPLAPEPAPVEPTPPRPPRDLTSLIQKAAILVGLAVIGIVVRNITGIEKLKTAQIPFQSVIKENEDLAAGPAKADSGALPLSPGARKDSLTLEARATDTVWVQLMIDGGPVREYIFRPNFRITWKAADKFVVTVGNAAAVHLTLNKKDLGALGRKGAVVQRLQLTRETLSHETPTR